MWSNTSEKGTIHTVKVKIEDKNTFTNNSDLKNVIEQADKTKSKSMQMKIELQDKSNTEEENNVRDKLASENKQMTANQIKLGHLSIS